MSDLNRTSYCHHRGCSNRATPFSFLDYHNLGSSGFVGYTPTEWCSMECLVASLMHAIDCEDMEDLQDIRWRIAYPLPVILEFDVEAIRTETLDPPADLNDLADLDDLTGDL
jgi:hypothetical protein